MSSTLGDDAVAIGCGAGFWGDRPDAAGQLLERADLDYLAMEYLAEVTMGLLDRLRRSDRPGYAADFVDVTREYLETAMAQNVTVVTNAGGLDPAACAAAVSEVAEVADLDLTIATVTGDDLTDDLDAIDAEQDLVHADTGEPYAEIGDDVVAAAAYLGAFPVAEALEAGADVVITGRIVDPALVLGPLLHEFDWQQSDYDRLAAGVVAGHLVECGTQVTGGNLSKDWRDIDFTDLGYPIATVDSDGRIEIAKPPGTGGAVSEATVAEQLVYEIRDPSAYLTPDVAADFTTPTLESVGQDRVAVRGVRGHAPPDQYKVSVHRQAGYKLAGNLLYSRPDALEKARAGAAILEERIETLGLDVGETRAEFIGHDGAHGEAAPPQEEHNEVMLRFAARGGNEADLRRLGKEFAPLSLAGPPSVAGLTDQGRPRPSPIVDAWPTLVPKTAVSPEVTVYE